MKKETKEYLSLPGLSEYDKLIKKYINSKDLKQLLELQEYTDNKVLNDLT